MKRIILAIVLAMFFAMSVASPAAAYSIRKYNCDFSKGVVGFIGDYVVSNGADLVSVLWSFVPKPVRTDNLRPAAEVIVDFEATGFLAQILSVGAGTKTNVRLDINALLHFACLEISAD